MRNTNKEEKEDIKGMISELLKGQLEINQDLLIKMSKPVKNMIYLLVLNREEIREKTDEINSE